MPMMLRDVRVESAHLSFDLHYILRSGEESLNFDQLSLAVNLEKFSISELYFSDFPKFSMIELCLINDSVGDVLQPAKLFARAAQKWIEMIGGREIGETDWKKVILLDQTNIHFGNN